VRHAGGVPRRAQRAPAWPRGCALDAATGCGGGEGERMRGAVSELEGCGFRVWSSTAFGFRFGV